jgi:DNA-directed RNA polymerase subunit RPC12/RpoP
MTPGAPNWNMTDTPKRPTLHLKLAPKRADPEPHAPAKAAPTWKCKPCGKSLQVDSALADDADVRCPSCNARLGLAADFRLDPPGTKVRARLVEA